VNFSEDLLKFWPGGNCTTLIKKELLYLGPFGLANWLCGVVFIDRLNPDKAHGTIRNLADRMNKENVSQIFVFFNTDLTTCI
jgi:lysophosphatidate acyltransferase